MPSVLYQRLVNEIISQADSAQSSFMLTEQRARDNLNKLFELGERLDLEGHKKIQGWRQTLDEAKRGAENDFNTQSAHLLLNKIEKVGKELQVYSTQLIKSADKSLDSCRAMVEQLPEIKAEIDSDKDKESKESEKERSRFQEAVIKEDKTAKFVSKLKEKIESAIQKNESTYGSEAEVNQKLQILNQFQSASSDKAIIDRCRKAISSFQERMNTAEQKVISIAKESLTEADLKKQYEQAKSQLNAEDKDARKNAKNTIKGIEKINRLVFGDAKTPTPKLDFNEEICKKLQAIEERQKDLKGVTGTKADIKWQELRDQMIQIETRMRKDLRLVLSREFLASTVFSKHKGGLDGSQREKRDKCVEGLINNMNDILDAIEKMSKEQNLEMKVPPVKNVITASEPEAKNQEIVSGSMQNGDSIKVELNNAVNMNPIVDEKHDNLENDALLVKDHMASQMDFDDLFGSGEPEPTMIKGLKSDAEEQWSMPNIVEEATNTLNHGDDDEIIIPTFHH